MHKYSNNGQRSEKIKHIIIIESHKDELYNGERKEESHIKSLLIERRNIKSGFFLNKWIEDSASHHTQKSN